MSAVAMRVGVVTVGRSDYGILRPILRALTASPVLSPALIVAGAHLAPAATTLREIEADGFEIAASVEMNGADDTAAAAAASMGVGVQRFAGAYASAGLDALLLLGDRFEMLAAGVAALPFALPVIHVHGGEITEGAFDDRSRHALTKLAHLHFVATARSAERVHQMGEEAWRVRVSGAPGLDELVDFVPLSRSELEQRIGLTLDQPPLLVTFHPATLEGDSRAQAQTLVDVLAGAGSVVMTAPNADPGSSDVLDVLRAFAARSRHAVLLESLGHHAYFSLMSMAAAMVGNSSSGIIEAPSLSLPVVNVGTRQAGRERAANVIDVPVDAAAIRRGIARALDPAFRKSLAGMTNPYGNGKAGQRIADTLPALLARPDVLLKRFVDVPLPETLDVLAGSNR
jgi:UDP-hydrolysing UDP-N-acetyl-D-glucosamine 2-epimerase